MFDKVQVAKIGHLAGNAKNLKCPWNVVSLNNT